MLQVVGLAMLLYVPPTIAQLGVPLSFAVVGMGTGFAIPAMMADPPLGAARLAPGGDVPAKGQMWTPIGADH